MVQGGSSGRMTVRRISLVSRSFFTLLAPEGSGNKTREGPHTTSSVLAPGIILFVYEFCVLPSLRCFLPYSSVSPSVVQTTQTSPSLLPDISDAPLQVLPL